MLDFLSSVNDTLGTIGDFIASIPSAIVNIFDFIWKCISECTALLGVIPTGIATLMTSALIFSVVVAVKRLVLD